MESMKCMVYCNLQTLMNISMQLKSIISTAVLFLIYSVTSHVVSQDWPQWRGVNRDAKVKGFMVPQTWPAQLELSWRVDVGLGDATPALVAGRLSVL